MSKSNANTLLQKLVAELEKLWHGKESELKTCYDSYELCRQIVKESEEE